MTSTNSISQSETTSHPDGQVAPPATTKVGFILLEHFSLVAFTGAVDALVTSNLVTNEQTFQHVILGLTQTTILSDLGIDIATSTTVANELSKPLHQFDVLIVCGGFRCDLTKDPLLTQYLKQAHGQQVYLGGLWNGAIALAHTGLVGEQAIAVHPDNHPYLYEHFPELALSKDTSVAGEQIFSCAGPISTLNAMVNLVEKLQGLKIARAVREILSSDQMAETPTTTLREPANEQHFPDPLKRVLELMRNNIEEPLSLEELLQYTKVSRRQLERMFQTFMESSPSRYYLELRLMHARRLLKQTSRPIIDIAIASGFVSSSHFSNCFKDYFGVAPSSFRRKTG